MSDPVNGWTMLGDFISSYGGPTAAVSAISAAIFGGMKYVFGGVADRAFNLIEYFKPHILDTINDHRAFVNGLKKNNDTIVEAVSEIKRSVTVIQTEVSSQGRMMNQQGVQITTIHDVIMQALDDKNTTNEKKLATNKADK